MDFPLGAALAGSRVTPSASSPSIFQSPCDSFFDSGCSGQGSSHAASIQGTVGKSVTAEGTKEPVLCRYMHHHVRTSVVETSMCLTDG